MSFKPAVVRCAVQVKGRSDIEELRSLLDQLGCESTRIIAKIEVRCCESARNSCKDLGKRFRGRAEKLQRFR
eukprot:222687-Chlamydomonas_euryale.AAC.1